MYVLRAHLLDDHQQDIEDDVDEHDDEDADVGHGEGARVPDGPQLVGRLHDGVPVPEAEERREGPVRGSSLCCSVRSVREKQLGVLGFGGWCVPGEGAEAREVGAEDHHAQQRKPHEDGHDLHEHPEHARDALVDDQDDGVLYSFVSSRVFVYENALASFPAVPRPPSKGTNKTKRVRTSWSEWWR